MTSQVNQLAVSADSAGAVPLPDSTESNVGGSGQEIDKKIRALKKKVQIQYLAFSLLSFSLFVYYIYVWKKRGKNIDYVTLQNERFY